MVGEEGGNNRAQSKITFLSVSFLMLILSATVFQSCRKETRPDYNYFISKELKISLSRSEIVNLLGMVETAYPDISPLKQSVLCGIDVYKVVYETTVSDRKIKASGLFCIPQDAGEYPVISFQNGTNTVRANAPSESVANPLYQMIELAASLGYIVVIADYPGFGESADIPHPYLITVPTVQSVIDMLYALKESVSYEFPGISVLNKYFLIGYSQGGWATLAVHKAMEQDHGADFNLGGSACGAGPYDMKMLFSKIIGSQTYNSPVFLAYIANAYIAYDQFTNPVSEILNEPYASRLGTLFNGDLTSAQINDKLTTSMPALIKADLISGFESDNKFASLREGLVRNSVEGWKTEVPLLLIHGGDDITVDPQVTEEMYTKMMQAGTDGTLIRKEIIQGVDHGKGIIPCMIKGLIFLNGLNNAG